MKQIRTTSGRQPIRPSLLLGGIVLVLGVASLVCRTRPPAAGPSVAPESADASAPPSGVLPVAVGEIPAAGKPTDPRRVRKQVRDDFVVRLNAIVREAVLETDPMRQEELLSTILNSLTPGEIPSALAALQNSAQPEIAKELGVRLIRRWAEIDSQTAAGWIGQLSAGPLRADGLDQLAIAWANREASQAASWARQLSDADERDRALRTVAGETARVQPVEALRLAAELPASAERDALLRRSASEWAARAPADAAAWVAEIPSGRLREEVLSGVTVTLAELDPVSAGNLAVLGLSGRRQANAVVTIAQQWIQRDPESAAAWVEQFPDGKLKQDAVESISPIWTLADAPRAQQWKSGQVKVVDAPATQ